MAAGAPENVIAGQDGQAIEATRPKAAGGLRSLVKEVLLTVETGELKIDVRGDQAASLAASVKSKPRISIVGDLPTLSGSPYEAFVACTLGKSRLIQPDGPKPLP